MMHHDLNIISHFKSKANEVKKKLILWTNRDHNRQVTKHNTRLEKEKQ